jgi:hypothetical protein
MPERSRTYAASDKRRMARLSPDAFRAAAYAKGWTLRALAERWEMTPEAVYRLAANANRAAYVDDALRGLPRAGKALPARPAWQAGVSPAAAFDPVQEARRAGPGMRYHGYMVVGAVVAVAKDLGSVAEEGMRGIVVQVSALIQPRREIYRVLFETGEMESFDADLVDEYLVTTGLERFELRGKVFRGDAQVLADYGAGMFVFYELAA